MSGRDVLHTSAEQVAAVQSLHPGGALRVLLPIASLHAREGDTPLGSDILRVEAAASGIRAELNAALPEVASWWTTPTLWVGPHTSPKDTAGSDADISRRVASVGGGFLTGGLRNHQLAVGLGRAGHCGVHPGGPGGTKPRSSHTSRSGFRRGGGRDPARTRRHF